MEIKIEVWNEERKIWAKCEIMNISQELFTVKFQNEE
jgi:hypothetical protein